MIKSGIANQDVAKLSGLEHKVYMPDDMASKPQPCLLMVHGRAGNYGVMWIFSKAVGKSRPVIIAPQAHEIDEIGGNSWWQIGQVPDHPEYPNCGFDEMYLKKPLEKLGSFIDSLPELYNVDPNKIIAFGFSQGAGLISAMSVARPGVFRGIAMLSGFLPATAAYQLSNKKVNLPNTFIFHGTEDKIITYDRAKADAELLRQAGANVEFVEDSVGHKVSSKGIRSLSEWYLGVSESF